MIRINSRTSRGTLGRPGLPCRIFQVQNSRKPLRCQAITVAALTMKTLLRHSLQTDESQTHRIRSVVDSFGLFTDRCSTPTWWRRARISTCSVGHTLQTSALINEAYLRLVSAEGLACEGQIHFLALAAQT